MCLLRLRRISFFMRLKAGQHKIGNDLPFERGTSLSLAQAFLVTSKILRIQWAHLVL
jgi:hypothetical protein